MARNKLKSKKKLLELMIEDVEEKREVARAESKLISNYDLDSSDDKFISMKERERELINPRKRIENYTRILTHLYGIDIKDSGCSSSLIIYDIKPRFDDKYDSLVVSPTYPSFSTNIDGHSYLTITNKSPVGKNLLELEEGDEFEINNKFYTIKDIY